MITPEQEEARKKYLGSSDMAALVGLDLWHNSSDVYLEKTGQLEPEKGGDSWLVKRIGNVFEKAVIDLFEEVRGVTVERGLFLTHNHYCSNLDGLVTEPNEIVEAKTTGKIDEWGEQYSDDIPERNIIQAHEQMYVVTQATGRECKLAWFPVLLPGYRSLEFRIYRVTRNDNLISDLIAVGNNFWNNHVAKGIPPDNYEPSYELLKRIKRIPNKIVDIEDKLVIDWQTTATAHTKAEKEAKDAKERLIAALGDGDAGETPGGRFVTFHQQSRAGYTVQPTTYPVVRAPKAKQHLKG